MRLFYICLTFLYILISTLFVQDTPYFFLDFPALFWVSWCLSISVLWFIWQFYFSSLRLSFFGRKFILNVWFRLNMKQTLRILSFYSWPAGLYCTKPNINNKILHLNSPWDRKPSTRPISCCGLTFLISSLKKAT